MSKPLEDCSREELIEIIKSLKKQKKFGLVWEDKPEKVADDCKTKLPVVEEVSEKCLNLVPDEPTNLIIEGDNYHALSVLNYTHAGKIDVIYIDPPYNRGKNDLKYNDSYVDAEDPYKHSKWLSFMNKRLRLAKKLLSTTGVIIVNIDEHESCRMLCLLNEIFGEQNNMGEIVWNKQNPKGDSHGVASMHETIFCFCKDREHFLTHGEVCIRKKLNAEIMVTKAQSLFKKIGKRAIPEEVASAIKPFNYSNKIKDDFYVTYDLALINKEFQNWLSKQKFSGGEKAYKYIDSDGRLYRGVSMAWPNKKTAPENYFIPLIHPVTQKPCPVPERGWRNPPATMAKLINDNLIIFGEDETKQPERKYFLDENMYENVPSIYENADSADGMLSSIGVSFEYPKPVSEATYLCSSIQPQAKVFLDFFAGSGTTGQAVLELNKEDGGHRQFILCTNNENKIAEEVTYPRIKTVITGKRMDGSTYSEGIPANLRYFKTGFVEKNRSTDATRKKLVDRSADMIRIRENAYVELKSETINKYFVSNDAFVAIIFDPFELAEAWAEIEKLNAEKKLVKLYIFSYSRDTSAFTDEIPETSLEWESIPIPESILQVYKRLFGRSK